MKEKVAGIILAAGKGTRMHFGTPKVLFPLCGRPIINYSIELFNALGIKNKLVVLGYKWREIRNYIPSDFRIAIQRRLLGTADAVKVGLGLLKDFKGTVLILYADNPLFKKETLKKFIEYHFKTEADLTLLTSQLEEAKGYGRIIRDSRGLVCKIAEETDLNAYEKKIKEVNSGVFCFRKDSLSKVLNKIRLNPRKKEYYLTDIVELFYKQGFIIETFRLKDKEQILGINSLLDLARAQRIMQRRINQEYLRKGVNIVDPETTFISYGTIIGEGSTIYPFTIIEKNVKIGKFCTIGPFVHIRENTNIKDKATVGNFLELVRTDIGEETLAKHFGYLGDARIGRRVNIGAGVVTANFDGKKKNKTLIEDNTFIGSDTILVAPIRVKKNSLTGAGSVVTKDVKENTVVVGVPAKPLKKDG
ncbi:MAG: sugar phosphate nucleotidyltransferase [Candidatus Omnitrophica bacterium]|nr:sugar phosphate nucleotidyltransferase [Candidatus Omnitrophota bacterium]